jgi:Asp-tRNA(Asn)/Glu-tRNA(Gln) amidotransferase A subunit family amidase
VTQLHQFSAINVRRLFQSRQASPVEYALHVFEHAEAVEPVVNAFAEEMFDAALDQARAAELRYGGKADPPRPLEGLLVAVKEELHIAGHVVSSGVTGAPAQPVPATDPAVARVLAAGGIVHARTTTSEFCSLPVSHTTRWGVTRNPWSPRWSAGGSSGGSAASLAAGTSALALGTDGGGSVRAPASLCGVVGYKPPYGRVPQMPPHNFDSWVHTGPLARTVEDCILLHNVIAGPDPVDNAALSPKLELHRPDGWIGDLRIGVCPVPGDH